MSQLNFNVTGKHGGDVPTLILDSENLYRGTFESDNRCIFTLAPTESGGATVYYDNPARSFRVIVPPGPGSWEAANPPCIPPEYNGDGSRMVLAYSAASGLVQIVGDHFELGGRRWAWAMMTGFCDYKLFLDGGNIREVLTQAQDLGCKGRRVLPNIVNIVNFNPDDYAAYWDRLLEYLTLNASYGQWVDFPVLSDTQYRGWSQSKCLDFWARFVETVRPATNRFVNLTNEYDHGGNLVGRPDDYPRPADMVVSQGSATQDKTPPNPKDGTGAGWGYWEWHAANEATKFGHEYYIWKGLSTGAIKPCVISEHGLRITEDNANNDYIRTLTYASLANGCGLTVHTEDGKYSRLLGPRQAAAVKTAMDILAVAL